MIERIVPAAVRAADAFGDRDIMLFPAERDVIAAAVDERRREFTTVRACARDALGQLGEAPVPLLPGLRGAPSWPANVVGSMTHCAGYRAAAVARASEVASLGIDAEPDQPLPDGVLDTIAAPHDLAGLRRLPGGVVSWDRLLFSAKESIYKTWFPLTRRWLDFAEATVTINQAGTFRARLLVAGPTVGGRQLRILDGRWAAAQGIVLTAVVLPA